MSDKLNAAYIQKAIEQRLGKSRRSVELSEEDYLEAISQALDLWNEYRSRVEYHRVDEVITTEGQCVSVPLDSCCIGVRTCFFLVPYYDVASGLTIFELAEKLAITRLGIQDIALTRSTWENYRRVRGVEPNWHLDRESDPRKLVFYAPSGPYTVGYELLYPYTDASQIEADRDATFLRLVEGYCRRILGEIRGKFGATVLGPGGSSVALNADRQMQEGDRLVQEVTETLKTSRPTMAMPMYF